MFPYFRLSVGCRSAQALEGWFSFLSTKGIACCIVKRSSRQFQLFREGREHTVNGIVDGYESLKGEIVKIYDPEGIFVEVAR